MTRISVDLGTIVRFQIYSGAILEGKIVCETKSWRMGHKAWKAESNTNPLLEYDVRPYQYTVYDDMIETVSK